MPSLREIDSGDYRKFEPVRTPTPKNKKRRLEITHNVEERASISGYVESFADFRIYLNGVIQQGISLRDVEGQSWGHENLVKLKSIIDIVDNASAQARIRSIRASFPPEINALARFIAPRLSEIIPYKKPRRYAAAVSMIDKLPAASRTTLADEPVPTPKEHILKQSLLDETFEFINISDEDSVSRQLMDPIRIGAKGISFKVNTTDIDDDINFGFVLPKQLQTILEGIRYPESNDIFKNWLISKCKSEDGVYHVIGFLKVLINFTAFLDSGTHIELFGSKVKGREREVVNNPFYSIKDAIVSLGQALHQYYPEKHPGRQDFRELIRIFELRYKEVYDSPHRPSLFTAHERALVTPPKDFAQLAYLLAKDRQDYELTVNALVKFAEAIGVTDISPLIEQFETRPLLQTALIEECRKIGFIENPEAQKSVLENLKANPWKDARDIDFANVINEGTTQVRLHVYTGTFGPMTRGHVSAIETLIDDIERRRAKGEDEVTTQDLILIIPITDVRNIKTYGKPSSRIGTLEQRIWIMLSQLDSSKFARDKVFITTALQPDPTVHVTTETRVQDTCNILIGQISDDLRNAHRGAGFTMQTQYLFGTDEIRFTGNPPQLAPKNEQKGKIRIQGSTAIIRSGDIIKTISCIDQIKRETGIHTIIFTPNTVKISSSSTIGQIESRQNAISVAPGARQYALEYYSQEARLKRESEDELEKSMSITQMSAKLIKDLENRLLLD